MGTAGACAHGVPYNAQVHTAVSDTGRSPRELEALLEGEHRRGAREVREPRRRGVEDLGELERLDGAHLLRVRVRVRVIRVRVRVEVRV